MIQRTFALTLFVGLSLGACKAKSESSPVPVASATPQKPVTGDGGSKDTPLALGATPLSGAVACARPLWFVLVPPGKGQIVNFSLRVKDGQPQTCVHVNARGAAGQILDSTISTCSDNPKEWAKRSEPFGDDVVFFTIDPNDPKDCSPAEFQISVAQPKK